MGCVRTRTPSRRAEDAEPADANGQLTQTLPEHRFTATRHEIRSRGGKVNHYNALTPIQSRTVADHRAAFEAVRTARAEMAHGYAGSMWWKAVGNAQYPYRKTGRAEKSLGRRSERTEAIHAQFSAGRDVLRTRLAGLEQALGEQIGLALGLGRIPALDGRILRRLDEAGAAGVGGAQAPAGPP